MAFKGITFAGQNVTPKNDGGLYQAHYGDGILWGCSMALSGDDLVIQSGEFIAGGRVCQVDGATNVDLSSRALTNGYIQVVMDFDTSKPEGLQWNIHDNPLIESATTTFPALTQEDINNAGTLYQVQLAVVQISGGNLTNIQSEMRPSTLESDYTLNLGRNATGGHAIRFYNGADLVGQLISVSSAQDMRLLCYDNGNASCGIQFDPSGQTLMYGNGSAEFIYRPNGVSNATGQVSIRTNGQITGGYSVSTSEKSTSTSLPTNTNTSLVTAIAKPSWAKFGIQYGYASFNRGSAGTVRMAVSGYSQDAYVPNTNGFLMSVAGVTTGTAALTGNPSNGTGTVTYAKLEVIWF